MLRGDHGYGGPHHDEVIALLASKGLEREYARLHDAGEAPFHQIVPASAWQGFTRDFMPTAVFSEIRDDVLFGDKHPPLAIWVFNQWLALFPHGQYEHAVVLVWMQIVAAAGLLMLAVRQHTNSKPPVAIGFCGFPGRQQLRCHGNVGSAIRFVCNLLCLDGDFCRRIDPPRLEQTANHCFGNGPGGGQCPGNDDPIHVPHDEWTDSPGADRVPDPATI